MQNAIGKLFKKATNPDKIFLSQVVLFHKVDEQQEEPAQSGG
jgi:hypothetical protein